jgi:large subunit ribosomal protein L16
MLFPKKTKFRKSHKGRVCGIETRVNNTKLGFYGVKSLSSGRLSSGQIECVRKIISRKMYKSGLLRLKIFPFFPVTAKPIEVRMGKGKGSLKYWCFPVKSGRVLFEFHGVSDTLASEINQQIKSKLPLKIKIIKFL